MHSAPFDDSMSGTTAVSVFFSGNRVYISNVGDSRAIIAQQDAATSQLVAKALSVDQTPFRKDERDRVKKTGARVMTVDQLEGVEPMHEDWGVSLGEEIDESGDPPRIWHPYGDYPGTAFTRSIGDAVSEELGVYAEPEIVVKELNRDDQFIVIASDGVFEFLTSQNVVDMVKEYNNPLDACRSVVEEAYNRWLQYEVRTDDITMICIFLKGIEVQRKDQRGSITLGSEMLDLESMQRPVRGIGTRDTTKRDTILGVDGIRLSITSVASTAASQDEEDYVIAHHEVKKSTQEKKKIREIVRSNFLFSHLLDQQLSDVISVMKRQDVEAGDIIIRQNEAGETFYIVSTGEYDVRVATADDGDDFGQIVHTYRATKTLHPTFGDLALIYSKPRAATIIAKTDGSLWTLDRLAFRSILMRRPMKETIRLLRSVEVLKPLEIAQIQRLAEEMQQVTFPPDTTIVKQGDQGDAFYLIIEGSCVVKKSNTANKKEEIVGYLEVHEYFGERALLNNEARAASVIASEKTVCLTIGRPAFESSLGRLSCIIEHDYIRNKRRTALKEAAAQAEPRTFVPFTTAAATMKNERVLVPLSKIQIHAVLSDDATDYQRLVSTEGGDCVTLRTVAKQDTFNAALHRQVVGEREVFYSLDEHCPIVVSPQSTCTTDTDIHMLYDTALVGDLGSFTSGQAQSEQIVRECAVEIILALESLHRNGIICRAIDPSSIKVDRYGHLKIMNLRLAKYVGTGRTYTLCGIAEYLSPEIVGGQGHGTMSDYWALGVLLYELLTGRLLFPADSENELAVFTAISEFDPSKLEFPIQVDPIVKDLLCLLLEPSIQKRLGHHEESKLHEELKSPARSHDFFKDIDWESISTSISGPLSEAAQERYEELLKEAIGNQPIDIGEEYTGENGWLNHF